MLQRLNKQVTYEIKKIQENRHNLTKAQNILLADMMNVNYVRDVKYWTDELLKQTEIEEKILKQKSKLIGSNWGMLIMLISMLISK